MGGGGGGGGGALWTSDFGTCSEDSFTDEAEAGCSFVLLLPVDLLITPRILDIALVGNPSLVLLFRSFTDRLNGLKGLKWFALKSSSFLTVSI